MPSPLNAYALPFRLEEYSDARCIFLTFSNGFPLSESQIFNYFNRFYAPYVDHVYVHRPGIRGRPPLFGKVMFKLSLIPDLVMGNSEKVCYVIDGLPVYCRRFVSQKSKPAASASHIHRDGGSHHGGHA